MKYLAQIIIVTSICTGCSLFHSPQSYEMERLSENVLSDKKGQGIEIKIFPIPATSSNRNLPKVLAQMLLQVETIFELPALFLNKIQKINKRIATLEAK